MDNKHPNSRAFVELSAFAADAEGDVENISSSELEERLTRQGISKDELAKLIARRLKRVRNEMDARQAQADADRRPRASAEPGKIRFSFANVQPIVARAEDLASDDDIEVILRLTQDEASEDANGT